RLDEEEMPPGDQPQPSKAEKQLIKQWIEAGAPPFPTLDKRRPFRSELDILIAIRDDLQNLDPAERKFQRYFTLANLHNNTQVRNDELALCRAALSKVVNSLSWEARIHVPRIVDREEQTIL